MHVIEFTCFMQRIQKKLDLYINSDIIYLIYGEYTKHNYENYTLFELLSMLDKRNICIPCAISKRSLIEFIEMKEIDIPYLLSIDVHKTKWHIQNLQYLDYTTYPDIIHINKNIICINDTETRTELYDSDVFIIDDKRYKIACITHDNTIIMQSANENITHTITQFIELIDTDSTIVLEHNHFRDDILHNI